MTGALLAFTTLAMLTWGGFATKMTVNGNPTPLVVSTLHIIATGGSILTAEGLILLLTDIPRPLLFLLVGFAVTVVYNCSLLVEEFLGRLLR